MYIFNQTNFFDFSDNEKTSEDVSSSSKAGEGDCDSNAVKGMFTSKLIYNQS